jgi:hypothetical protein
MQEMSVDPGAGLMELLLILTTHPDVAERVG